MRPLPEEPYKLGGEDVPDIMSPEQYDRGNVPLSVLELTYTKFVYNIEAGKNMRGGSRDERQHC